MSVEILKEQYDKISKTIPRINLMHQYLFCHNSFHIEDSRTDNDFK